MKPGSGSREGGLQHGVEGKALGDRSAPLSPLDLGYFREARLFLAKNRATLTFFAGNEVASIHYDKTRDEIFYKGHNVKNMTLTDDQWLSLQKFPDFLAQDPEGKEIRDAYKRCLEQFMLSRFRK
jgi:hypothetical protein